MIKYLKNNFSLVVLSGVFLISLLNPVLKKYDYGAGFPIVILFSVLLFFVVLFEKNAKAEDAPKEKSMIYALIALFIFGFINSKTQNLGFSEVLAFVSVFITYLTFAYKKNKFMQKFLKVVAFSSILAVILGYILYIYLPEPRMVGPFFNILYHAHMWPNAFALFLLSSWPIFLLYFDKKKPRTNFVYTFLLGLVITGLFLSFSRGAIIAFFGQIILVIIYFFKRIKIKTLTYTLLLVIFSGSLFFGMNHLRNMNHQVIDIEERATFGNSESLTSKQERIDFWEGSIVLIKNQPLTGYGPFSFRYAYNEIQETFLGNADHPHNLFLKIGVEYGLVTLFVFICFLLTGAVTVLKRFSVLNNNDKDLIYILFVSVAGVFAHNLIDYNLNFLVNLLILFLFLAFMRSIVSNKHQSTNNFGLPILALGVCIISLYEGSLLVMAETKDEDFLKHSLFPRNYYLSTADEMIQDKDFESALEILNIQNDLNNLDAQSVYLTGVIYCDEDFINFNKETCKEYFKEAIELNPQNELGYYRDYSRLLEGDELELFKESITPLLLQYFNYVEYNVHFTAYTSNVEAAAEIIDMHLPNLLDEKEKMLQTAANLRSEKTY